MASFFYAQILLHGFGSIAGFLFKQDGEKANRSTHFLAVLAGLAGAVLREAESVHPARPRA